MRMGSFNCFEPFRFVVSYLLCSLFATIRSNCDATSRKAYLPPPSTSSSARRPALGCGACCVIITSLSCSLFQEGGAPTGKGGKKGAAKGSGAAAASSSKKSSQAVHSRKPTSSSASADIPPTMLSGSRVDVESMETDKKTTSVSSASASASSSSSSTKFPGAKGSDSARRQRGSSGLWVDELKPTTSGQILGHNSHVRVLKAYLARWAYQGDPVSVQEFQSKMSFVLALLLIFIRELSPH